VGFKIDESFDAVFLRESPYQTFPMFPNATDKIGRYARVQSAAELACHNVHVELLHLPIFMKDTRWIPACTGMTGFEASSWRIQISSDSLDSY